MERDVSEFAKLARPMEDFSRLKPFQPAGENLLPREASRDHISRERRWIAYGR